ncbi:MAG: GPW/gp25 family protein [Alkalinema sp. RU_4_3]|nr:GPW/gp25 family protein [Alkalinema sp. RU_4_3]
MTKSFLGKGISFPLQLSTPENHSLTIAAYEESVRQSVLIILGTEKGERVMRPDFGCGIYDLVFEPKSAATAGKITHEVQDSLLRFEPRIDVLAVETTSQSLETGEALVVSIRYEVRATNNVFNLVYPFYLERSAES